MKISKVIKLRTPTLESSINSTQFRSDSGKKNYLRPKINKLTVHVIIHLTAKIV